MISFWSWRHGTNGRNFTRSDHIHSCCNQHLPTFTIGTTGIIGWWTSFHLSILDGISSKGRHMRSIFGMNSFTLINLLLTCTSTQGILCMFVARPSLFYSSHVVCWSPLMVRPHMDLLIKTTNLETPVTCGKKETTSGPAPSNDSEDGGYFSKKVSWLLFICCFSRPS